MAVCEERIQGPDTSVIGPKIYLGSPFFVKDEAEWLKVTGCRYKCYSYAYVAEGAFLFSEKIRDMMEVGFQNGIGIMLDSGGYSFHQFTRKKSSKNSKVRYQLVDEVREQVVDHYVDYIQKNQGRFDFYVNFDYVKEADKVYKMQKRLERKGIQPLPMYHGDTSIEWLRRYLEEGYDYIGLGSLRSVRASWGGYRYFYDRVFDLISKYEVGGRKIKTHGFARTSFAIMWTWPWYSVDSSSWTVAAANGYILLPSTRGLACCHVSNRAVGRKATQFLEPGAMKHLERFVGEKGFELEKMRSSREHRDLFNGWVMAHLQDWRKPYLERQGERTKWVTLL